MIECGGAARRGSGEMADDYHSRRASQERIRAQLAVEAHAREAHKELARLHEQQAQTGHVAKPPPG
jgi:hypothetical protein